MGSPSAGWGTSPSPSGPGKGVPPSGPGMGYPLCTWDGVTPHQEGWGTPQSTPGMGVPPSGLGMGYTPPCQLDGVLPPPKVGQTHTCENITSRYPSNAGGNKVGWYRDLGIASKFSFKLPTRMVVILVFAIRRWFLLYCLQQVSHQSIRIIFVRFCPLLETEIFHKDLQILHVFSLQMTHNWWPTFSFQTGNHNYRPHPKDGGRYCFQFVSPHPGRGGGGPRSRWGGVPGPVPGGGGTRSQVRGSTRSQVQGRGGVYPVSVKGKIFDTRFGLIHVQTGKKNFCRGTPPPWE